MASTVDPWPRRRRMPELASLDPATRASVRASVARLREHRDGWVESFLALAREHVPGYDILTDDEIRESARSFIDGELVELAAFRIPDDALRARLEEHAQRRLSQGMSLETLTTAYQLGSRELLALMDRIGAETGLPPDLVIAVHDSTWEFANEASAVFARVQRDLSVERARFDAERRAAFTRGVLNGSVSSDDIHRDAHLFGLEPRGAYVAIALRPTADARAAIARALHMPGDRLLFADMGATVGGILPVLELVGVDDRVVGASRPAALDALDAGFDDAVVALETGERFGAEGVVRLADLGPRPLVLAAERVANGLEERVFATLDADGRSGEVIRETARVYLEYDQSAPAAAARLLVHANTVRYRMGRFAELTGLDLRRTEDVVTAWWLLHRRPEASGR